MTTEEIIVVVVAVLSIPLSAIPALLLIWGFVTRNWNPFLRYYSFLFGESLND